MTPRPVRVGILVLKASTGAGGLETYEVEIVRAIARLDSVNEYRIICADPVDPGVFGISQPNITFHQLRPRARPIALTFGFRAIAKRLGLDVCHVTFVPPVWPGVPYVFTAHGPEMFVNPRFYPLAIRLRMNPLIRHAYTHSARILAVSQATSTYLQDRFRIPASKISVVHNGVNPVFRPVGRDRARAALEKRWGITDPFALFVGRVEPRKNPVRVLEAFASCREQIGPGFKLVIAGDKTWSARDVDAAVARLQLRPHIVELGHIPLDGLIELYNCAEMLVYPSLWEGFGLPILEAMACGCPVVTANIASMPEVAGGGAVLVDPMSSPDIARGMVSLATDRGLRDRLRAFGLERVERFSWESAARQTIGAYLDVAGVRG